MRRIISQRTKETQQKLVDWLTHNILQTILGSMSWKILIIVDYVLGSLRVSAKLPTYPSPKPTLSLTSHLGQNVALKEGWVDSFPETFNTVAIL